MSKPTFNETAALNKATKMAMEFKRYEAKAEEVDIEVLDYFRDRAYECMKRMAECRYEQVENMVDLLQEIIYSIATWEAAIKEGNEDLHKKVWDVNEYEDY